MTQDWISWDTASELTGIKVPTIEHAVRVGRIQRRPRRGNYPSLRRDSVMAWADWYREMDQQRVAAREGRAPRKRRPARRGPAQTGPPGWLDTQEAGRRLDRTPRTILRWVTEGELAGQRLNGRLWLDPDSVEDVRLRRGRWVSWVEAAKILNCSVGQIRTLAGAGEFVQRDGPSAQPSLERASVEAYRDQRDAEQANATRTAPTPLASAPPDDGHVWLSTTVVAIMIGIEARAVSRLVRLGRLPGVKRGVRVWVRREDAETAAAARRFADLTRLSD